MSELPMQYGLGLAALLFALGVAGVIVRRNLIFMLLSIEVMLNGTGLAFVTGGAHWGEADGQVMYLLVVTLAAAEAAVGLALILQVYHRFASLDADRLNRMRG